MLFTLPAMAQSHGEHLKIHINLFITGVLHTSVTPPSERELFTEALPTTRVTGVVHTFCHGTVTWETPENTHQPLYNMVHYNVNSLQKHCPLPGSQVLFTLPAMAQSHGVHLKIHINLFITGVLHTSVTPPAERELFTEALPTTRVTGVVHTTGHGTVTWGTPKNTHQPLYNWSPSHICHTSVGT